MRKKRWFYALLLVVQAKLDITKAYGFFAYLRFITNQGEEQEELTTRRRNEWISPVSHDDATNNRVLESERVCSKRFALKLPEQSGFGR